MRCFSTIFRFMRALRDIAESAKIDRLGDTCFSRDDARFLDVALH